MIFGLSVYYGINLAVDRAVRVDAEAKGRQWAEYFIETMPRLGEIMSTGRLDEEQHAVLTSAERVGDVFRFKLFDQHGGVVLASDEFDYNADPVVDREHSATAAAVIATGVSNVSVNDGTGVQNRPPLYAEAYVPIEGAGGRVEGVVEVYLDQTQTAALFRTTFAVLAAGLAVAAGLAFGLPMLAYVLRSKQANDARSRVEFLASHDAMTGLLNRTSANKRLEWMLRERTHDLAVVLIDVDDIKAINDTKGHGAGDALIEHVARALAAACGPHDLAGRPGGDEFILVLADRTRDQVNNVVKGLLAAVREPISVAGHTVLGRVSAGIYLVGVQRDGLADVMRYADAALVEAKIDGGNCYRYFSPELEERLRNRREIEQRIRDGLENKLFDLHYQPLFSAKDHRCAGFEALLRLPDGAGGFIPPSDFIPIAERVGLINEIGRRVIHEAARTAAGWSDNLFVSINLSARQFADGLLVGHVRSALAESGLRPGRLEVEITESMLIENTEEVAAQLNALHELGISIAMDDFGTGYSSLGYLWQFGFDKLKIDRTFVAALEHNDQQARAILDTIIVLGHKLNMTVTAEGIETEHQASVLAGLDCDHFQGFLYGRPKPAADLAPLLLGHVVAETDQHEPSPVALRA